LLAGAAQAQIAGVATTTAWSTTTTGVWLPVTPLTTPSVACIGSMLRIEVSLGLFHSVVGAGVYTGLAMDGVLLQSASLMNVPGVNYTLHVAWVTYVTPSAGNHTFGVFVNNATAGTLTFQNGVNGFLYVTEQRR